MNTDHEKSPVLRELAAFLEFLHGLWAALASVSVLFPLSNSLIGVIPQGIWPDGGFAYFPPPIVTIVTTVACLFLVLWTFGQRRQYRKEGDLDVLPRQAGLSFIAGVAALVIYLVCYFAVREGFYFNVLGWESDDLRRIAGDALLMIAYAAFFVLVTRAFLLLGLREYVRDQIGLISRSK